MLQLDIVDQLPTLTKTEIVQYLSCGLFRGIGQKTAAKLVDCFGEQTLVVLDTAIARLYQVPALPVSRINAICEAWEKSKSNPARAAAALLLGRGTSVGLTVKICDHYQEKTLAVLQQDPYKLIDDIDGVGFKTADALALSLGVAPDSEQRYIKALVHVLEDALTQGHCFLPENVLAQEAMSLLALPEYSPSRTKLGEAIALAKEQQVLIDGDLSGSIYKKNVYRSELRVALHLRSILNQPPDSIEYLENWLQQWESAAYRELTILSLEQRQALLMAERYPFSILTGGPGRGKTHILKVLVEWLLSAGQKVALAAPTGKAANRMQDACRHKAFTIHRLLQWQGVGRSFRYNERNPIDLDWLIVDEFSMVDIFLFNSLLKALPEKTKILLVGDADQLPSVGAGMVLKDLLNSEMVPTTRLKTIYRQQHESAIIHAADAVNSGNVPALYKFNRVRDWMDVGDCAMLETSTPEATAEAIVQLAQAMKAENVDLNEELMVLSPQKKGVCGVHNLNKRLQEVFNPKQEKSQEVVYGEAVFRTGDRVIQLVNRYDTDPAVMNGEMGRIIAVEQKILNEKEKIFKVTVEFEGGAIVDYNQNDIEEIMHSFSITCHKSQGSEFRYAIMPLITSHYRMLTRQLLYTTMTRAMGTFIAVGQRKALEIAVATDKPARRYTQLLTQLVEPIDQLVEKFNRLQVNQTAEKTSQATITVASRLQQRNIEATTGQMTSIGSLALRLYEDKYGNRPSRQPEQVGKMRFKTYHYPVAACDLIDRAIDLVLKQ
ncbi:MAG TPA: ATP-dependent RecD-like DNA helicase [Cyanobacteria bacterium UBA11369]|nr:ATP-dependent RecD-like DNA helicase [Cyanobacteria bacterium UBA11371]HBE51497.1 ATP-dependent RecD-like DNA helicase [Cyanobacteria bacterium UBA11369]